MNIFITVVGMKNYEKSYDLEVGKIVYLVKEPENTYDNEALVVLNDSMEKLGYAANSVGTVAKGTMSGGKAGVFLKKISRARVLFMTYGQVIIEVIEGKNEEIIKLYEDQDDVTILIDKKLELKQTLE